MMRLIVLIVLISANCIKMNCDEEPSTTDTASVISEKSDLSSEHSDSLQSKTENNEAENQAREASEDGEEIRVSRSSNDSTKSEAQLDDSTKTLDPDISVTEKTAPNESIGEIDRQAVEEVGEAKDRASSAETLQDNTKSAENVEKDLEESPEAPKSATENEDRKAEDLSEASAESKLSDNENASSKVDETDRSSETEEIKEKSDESGLKESLETRRTLSAPDQIVIDTKMRSDTTSKAVQPEVKTALNQNLNTYNFNEFGTERNIKLVDNFSTEPPSTIVKTIPVNTNLASQEIFNQQYFPKFYPRPELNINFPNINSDFQGPRDLPIYLKVKQDEYQVKNQFPEPQYLQLKSTETNTQFNQRNLQQYHQSQKLLDPPGTFINKQFANLQMGTKYQVPQYYQNLNPTNFPISKRFMNNPKQSAILNQYSRSGVQQFHQNQQKINSNYKNLESLNGNAEPRNEIQDMVKSKIHINIKEQGNEYPLFQRPQEILDSKIYLENKQFGAERSVNPYSYQQPPNMHQANPINIPKTYNDNNRIPAKIKFLFQKLASASEYPSILPSNLYNNHNIQNYPYFVSPEYGADFTFYDLSYMPGYQHPT